MNADLGESLLRASRVLVGVAAKSLAPEDVTLPQFRALVVLAEQTEVTLSHLADALSVHSTTATRLCDRLVAKNLIVRERDGADRRILHLRLSASGARLVAKVWQRRRAELEGIAARMGPGDAAAAIHAFWAFAEAAGEPAVGVDLFGWEIAEG